MKKYFFLTSFAFLLLACNNSSSDKSIQQKDSLLSVLNQRDTFINDLIVSFNGVESNLDSIASKQRLIYLNSDKKNGDIKANQKEHINSMIAAINDLMNKNKTKIAELSNKLKSSNNKNAELEKLISSLNNQLEQKNAELFQLNGKLAALNIHAVKLEATLDSLTSQNYMQSMIIGRETKTIQTAYYIVGKSKELRDAKVIDKKGGLLGMGKTSKLNSDFDEKKFTKIDYTKTTEIIINSMTAKIITSHPSDSYKLDTDKKGFVKNIVITNPEKFWRASKYLVVQID